MRRAARRDANEPELIKLARRLGAHPYMAPPLDWWTWVARQGRWVPVEIKRPEREGTKHELTPAQRRFVTFCTNFGAPYFTWRVEADVYRDLGARVSA